MENYSVKAVLSAVDKGFTKTVGQAENSVASLADRIKSGIGFGALIAVGQKAFNTLSAGLGNMVSELQSSQATWSTFEGNMMQLGKGADEINSVKKELQSFAQKTIYSASDMASTYSQLEAVGIKNTESLVKGFGGLAAAAEDPVQAMKTLSTQATQMAAKPKVAWQDFKLMMEQTPAGMAAVAKEMGMDLSTMLARIQDNTLSTEEFFDAVQKVGTSDGFMKMATTYKNAGQAMDGLKEAITNQLGPAFKVLDTQAQQVIGAISDALSKVDVEKLTAGIQKVLDTLKNIGESAGKFIGELFENFKKTGAIESTTRALGKLWEALVHVVNTVKDSGAFQNLATLIGNITKAVMDFVAKAAEFIASLPPETIRKITSALGKLVKAFIALKVIKAAKNKVMGFVSSTKQAASALKSLIGKLKKTPDMGNAGASVPAPKTENATSGWAKFGSVVESIGKSIKSVFEGLEKVVKSVFKGIGSVFKSFGTMIKTIFQGVGTVLKSFGTMVKTIFQGVTPVIKALGQALATVAKGIGEGISIALQGLGKALASIPPTTWLAMAVAALAFGAALALIGSQGEGLRALLEGLATVIGAFAPIVQTVVDGIVAVVQSLPGLLESAGASIKSIFEGIGSTIESVGTSIATVVESISTGVAEIVEAIGGTLKGILDGIAGIIKALGDSSLKAGKGFKQFAAGVKTLTDLNLFDMTGTLISVSANMGALALTAPGIGLAGTGLKQIGSGLKTISTVGSTAASNLDKITPALTNFQSGISTLGSDLQSVAAAMVVFGAGAILASAGLAGASGSIQKVADGLSSIASTAGTAASGIQSFAPVLRVASEGFKVLSSACIQAVNKVKGSLSKLPGIASNEMNGVIMAFNRAATSAYQSGVWIGTGFANGMLSTLAVVRSAANELAAQADKAIRAKAKIASPSKVMAKNGQWMGIGFANGMEDTLRLVRQASANLFQVPDLQAPSLSFASLNDSLHNDSLYGAYHLDVAIDAPVTLDGRKVGQMTAVYSDEELKKRAKVRSRLQGVR